MTRVNTNNETDTNHEVSPTDFVFVGVVSWIGSPTEVCRASVLRLTHCGAKAPLIDIDLTRHLISLRNEIIRD